MASVVRMHMRCARAHATAGQAPRKALAPRPIAPRPLAPHAPPHPLTQVCAVMQNSSEVAQCAKPDAVGSLDAAALQACGVRTCQASDALLLPRRWLAVEPTPVTLVLVYVLLTVAALVPRKWLDSLPW